MGRIGSRAWTVRIRLVASAEALVSKSESASRKRKKPRHHDSQQAPARLRQGCGAQAGRVRVASGERRTSMRQWIRQDCDISLRPERPANETVQGNFA